MKGRKVEEERENGKIGYNNGLIFFESEDESEEGWKPESAPYI